MVQDVLVVGRGVPYDFVPEGQAERLTGQKIHYILTDAPLVGEGAEGYQPVSASVPLTVAAKITVVPAMYRAAFSVSMRDGKPTIKLCDFDQDVKPLPVDF